MDEKLKLSDYLLLATTFNEDPSEENLKFLEDYLNHLEVKEYMSLKDKDIIMTQVLTGITKDFDAPGAAAFLEMGKIEKGLFSYCTNLEIDTGTLLNTYVAHDLYNQHGLVDYILQRCEKDYNHLCTMIDNAIQFSNIYRLIESAQLLDVNEYDKWMDAMRDVKDTIKSQEVYDIISSIRSIEPGPDELVETLQKSMIESAQMEYETDHNKFQEAIKSLSKEENVQEDIDGGNNKEA